MIQIVIQRRNKMSFFKTMFFLKKEFNLNTIDSFLLCNKLRKRYGLVISTAISSKQQCMYDFMDQLHNRLYRLLDASWRQDVENVATQISRENFTLYKMYGEYRLFVANKSGYVDSRLTIY